MLVHKLQKLYFNLGLIEEGLLVLDDLDGHILLVHAVIGLHHLYKTPSTNLCSQVCQLPNMTLNPHQLLFDNMPISVVTLKEFRCNK